MQPQEGAKSLFLQNHNPMGAFLLEFYQGEELTYPGMPTSAFVLTISVERQHQCVAHHLSQVA